MDDAHADAEAPALLHVMERRKRRVITKIAGFQGKNGRATLARLPARLTAYLIAIWPRPINPLWLTKTC